MLFFNHRIIFREVRAIAIKAYVRCSTNETKQDLDRQINDIQIKVGRNTHVDFYKEFEHGDTAVKKELNKLFNEAQAGDTIITTEVSRLSRSTKQLCEIIDTVKEKRLCLQILGSITIDCRDGHIDPMTEAFLTMSGVFAQLELAMIRQRVKSGMENARTKGKTIGRPRLTRERIPDAFFKHYPLYATKKINKNEFSDLLKISRPTLNNYLAVVEKEGN